MSEFSPEKRASIEAQRADVHAAFMALNSLDDRTPEQEQARLQLRQKMMDYDMALNPPVIPE